jgi:uncharacterized protein YidB (DUF937 family)
MSISAIGSDQTSAVQQVQQMAQHHGHGGMRKAGMDAAAKALGMSTSDLQTALRSGQSMSDLAKSKGVSLDTLTADISAAVSKANPSLSTDRAQQIALRFIAGPTGASGSSGSGGSAAVG